MLPRVIGVLYVAAGLLGLVSIFLPHPSASDETGLAVNGMAAILFGALFFAFAAAVPRWLTQVSVALGSAMIALAVYFSGAAGVFSSMFVWIAAFTALFLSRRATFLQVSWLLACYAVALLNIDDATGYSALTRILLTGLGLFAVAALTSWLVRRRKRAEERTRQFFDLSRDMLCTANTDGYLLELNGAWTATLGYSPGDLRSRPYAELIHPDDRDKVRREMARTFEGHGPAMFDCRLRAEDGAWRWLLWSASFSDETGLVFARATDITVAKDLADQREALVKELDSIARTDPLTGIPNRRWLDTEIQREMARSTRDDRTLGLAMLDLDRFKAYNDEHGHPAGDELLKAAVESWRAKLRTSDFLARYGGEEFVVLVPESTPAEAEEQLNRLRAATPEAITCSAGVAFWDGHEDASALIARADTALYAAKESGRDRTVLLEVSEQPL
jgi:diguanylate cyclase (GGDEF)-like protein/PAS domain S-box-containing protein